MCREQFLIFSYADNGDDFYGSPLKLFYCFSEYLTITAHEGYFYPLRTAFSRDRVQLQLALSVSAYGTYLSERFNLILLR